MCPYKRQSDDFRPGGLILNAFTSAMSSSVMADTPSSGLVLLIDTQ